MRARFVQAVVPVAVALALIGTLHVWGQSSLLVVPGGQGFGMTTRAAYGCGGNPAILRVTNLNDSGSGSFRAALEASGSRVVIFEISGTIVLSSDLGITNPCVTVAGQTAPSPGITIRGADDAPVSAGGLVVYTHDVLIQHIRIRPGDGGPRIPQTEAHDATLNYKTDGDVHDVVWDHVSISWAGGKNTNIVTFGNPANVTYYRCFITEALFHARNIIVDTSDIRNPSSLGMLIASSNRRISIIQNLWAHNQDRNPEIHDGSEVHFVNNVVYDWGGDDYSAGYAWASFFYAGTDDNNSPYKADVIGNKYIAGPGAKPNLPLYAIGVWSSDSGSALYKSDNAIDGSRQPVEEYINYQSYNPLVSNPPVPLSGITLIPSSDIEGHVLANAGARPADRDSVDARIVGEVSSRTGRRISSQNEVGGWPALAVNMRPLAVPSDPHAVTGTGYTNLERWLQQYAAAVEGRGGTVTAKAPQSIRISQ